MQYWLMKSEPDTYSIDNLKRDGKTQWEGIRNYQARNFMRDIMRVGDVALFYHSSCKVPGVVGVMEVCSEPYPDHFAQDPTSNYYDPKATPEKPIWEMVDLKFMEKLPRMVSLAEIKKIPQCGDMLLLKKGQRLSIQPITQIHYDAILKHSQKMEDE